MVPIQIAFDVINPFAFNCVADDSSRFLLFDREFGKDRANLLHIMTVNLGDSEAESLPFVTDRLNVLDFVIYQDADFCLNGEINYTLFSDAHLHARNESPIGCTPSCMK